MSLGFAGIKIITNPLLVESYEDWSAVRSPARARRRRRMGHPQRIEIRTRPRSEGYMLDRSTLVIHPAMLPALEARLGAGAALTRPPAGATLSRQAGEGSDRAVNRGG